MVSFAAEEGVAAPEGRRKVCVLPFVLLRGLEGVGKVAVSLSRSSKYSPVRSSSLRVSSWQHRVDLVVAIWRCALTSRTIVRVQRWDWPSDW